MPSDTSSTAFIAERSGRRQMDHFEGPGTGPFAIDRLRQKWNVCFVADCKWNEWAILVFRSKGGNR